MEKYGPVVMMSDFGSVPYLVFAKGRKLYHAITADTMIRMTTLETLRGLRPLERKGKPYPPRRAASHWLNHDHREFASARAKAVLRGLVARKKQADGAGEDL